MRNVLLPVGRWIPIFVLLAAIWLEAGTAGLTFVPGEANDLLVRKIGHAAVYALLAILVRWALGPHPDIGAADPTAKGRHAPGRWVTAAKGWWIPLAFAASIAVADELLQAGSPGRQPKITDVATDVTGAIAALVLLRSSRVRHRQRGARPQSPLVRLGVEELRGLGPRPADGEI